MARAAAGAAAAAGAPGKRAAIASSPCCARERAGRRPAAPPRARRRPRRCAPAAGARGRTAFVRPARGRRAARSRRAPARALLGALGEPGRRRRETDVARHRSVAGDRRAEDDHPRRERREPIGEQPRPLAIARPGSRPRRAARASAASSSPGAARPDRAPSSASRISRASRSRPRSARSSASPARQIGRPGCLTIIASTSPSRSPRPARSRRAANFWIRRNCAALFWSSAGRTASARELWRSASPACARDQLAHGADEAGLGDPAREADGLALRGRGRPARRRRWRDRRVSSASTMRHMRPSSTTAAPDRSPEATMRSANARRCSSPSGSQCAKCCAVRATESATESCSRSAIASAPRASSFSRSRSAVK